ncbi:hypothetical protein, partial [Bacillus sp. TH008]|uniref:hypothetical protein n=1 Tax=Bacillus sp. TH008 TaxID=1609979 RepID=UPI001F1BDCBD
LNIYVRFSCLYRMTKWNRKSPPFYPPFCRIFLGLEQKNLERPKANQGRKSEYYLYFQLIL